MKKVRRISKKYYFKEIVAYWLVCWMLFGIPAQIAQAAPTGGTWEVGTGTIVDGVQHSTVVVEQTESIIKWGGFNTASDESVAFSQGVLSNSAVLNKILSGSPTQFDGALNANDMRIFVVNPAGVIFGAGSSVNVNQLVASSMNMSNDAFLNAVTGVADGDMVFTNPSSYSGARLVGNLGTINAADSVYLVGKNVLNAGTIVTNPGGLVAMVAGDEMVLAQPGSSTIVKTLVVNHIENHTVDNGAIGGTSSNLYDQFGIDESGNTGTVSTGELVLAAGDVWSNAIANVQDLTAIARGDIHFEEAIDISGDLKAQAGLPTQYESEWIDWWEGPCCWPTHYYEEQPVVVKRGGDVHAKDTIDAGGDMTVLANGITLDGDAVVGGDMALTGRWGEDPVDGFHDIETAALTAGGNIDISVTGVTDRKTWVYEPWEKHGFIIYWWEHPGEWVGNPTPTYEPGTITLNGDVTAIAGDLTLYNNTDVTVPATLQAGTDLVLLNGPDPMENCATLDGTTSLTLIAGNEIQAENTTIEVTGSWLELQQGLTLDLKNFTFGSQSTTDIALESSGGSVIATDTADGGKDDNAADQWASIGAKAKGGVILSGHESDIEARRLEADKGGIDVHAKDGSILANDHGFIGDDGIVSTGGGNVTLEASDDVVVDGDIDAQHGLGIRPVGYNSDVTITAGENITINGTVDSAGNVEMYADTDITLCDTAEADGYMYLSADDDEDDTGDLSTKSLTTGDYLYAYGQGVTIDGSVDSGSSANLYADRDEDGTGDLYVTGSIEAVGSLNAEGENVTIDGAVHSGSHIYLNANRYEDNGGDLVANSSVDAGGGYLSAYGENITMEGPVSSDAEMELTADRNTDGTGDLWVKNSINSGDSLTAEGENITFDGVAQSSAKMELTADRNGDGTGNVDVHGLISGGTIEISAADDTIKLHKSADTMADADVDADVDIILNNDTEADAGVVVKAGEDVVLAGGKTLDGLGALTLEAGDNIMFGVDNQLNPESGSAGNVSADGDLTLDADGSVYAHGTLTTTSGGNIEIYSSDTTTYLYGDYIDAGGSILLNNTTEAYGDILAGQNVTLNGTVELKGVCSNANQRIRAEAGQLYANDWVHKTTAGDLEMFGGFNIDNWPVSSVWAVGDVTVDNGELAILGNACVRLDGSIYSSENMELAANQDGDSSLGHLVHYGGTIKSLNGDVDMSASGDWIYLDGGDNLIDAYVSAGGDLLLNDNTWVQYSRRLDAGDDVVLANGEQLHGNGSLTVKAIDDIMFGVDVATHESNPTSGSSGYVTVNGDMVLDTGDDIFAHGKLNTTNGGNITGTAGGDIMLYATPESAEAAGTLDLDAGDTLYAAGDLTGNMTLSGYDVTVDGDVTSLGALDVDADHDIKLKKNVSSVDEMTMDAGDDIELNYNGGDTGSGGYMEMYADDRIEVRGDVESGGYMDMETCSGDIKLKRDVYSGGSMTLDAGDDIELNYWSGDTESVGNMVLDADDDIYAYSDLVSTDGSIELYSSNYTTKLYGDVTAYDSVLLNNKTELRGSGDQRVEATTGTLTAKRDVDKKTSGDLELAGAGGIYLGDDVSTKNGHLIFEDAVIANGTGSRRNQTFDADGFGKRLYAWDTITKTTCGDLTLDGGTSSGYEIDLDGDVTVTDGDLILGPGLFADDTTVADGKTLAASDDVKVYGDLNGEGDLTVDAGDDAKLYGDVEADGDLDIYASDSTIYLHGDAYAAGDLSLHANTEFEGWDDQYVDAGGMLTADGYLNKLNTKLCGLLKSSGNLYLHAGGDISLADYVRAACCGECGNGWGGGVSIISENGTIYTPGGLDDTLNVPIIGRSSFKTCGECVWGITGVDLPYGDGKAAIVIISKNQDLKLGSGAELTACGRYDETIFDDRPGVDFLDHIEGVKNPGDAIDVAIYLASYWDDGRTGGNVTIGSPVICIADNGAMVVDALDSVSFGPDFINSLIGGKVGWLEVCSRISATLGAAIGRLPYADNPGAYPGTGRYVLRGEDPEGGTGAWVLASTGIYTHRNYEPAPDEEVEFPLGGCPALMTWLADELGMSEEDLQVYIANSFALSTDIQPCEMCARLKDAAMILDDETQIAALGRVVNEFITPGAPPSPEQMTLIAAAFAEHTGDGTYYAAAGEWVDALVAYVSIMTDEMGLSAGDAVGMFTEKHSLPEGMDATVLAYVEARLAGLGG